MKKVILALVLGLLLVSFVAGAKPQDPSDILLQAILSKLIEIKDVLVSMLTSIQNIEAKDTTVNVTVESILTEECQWEKLNQRQPINLVGPVTGGMLQIPSDKGYKEVNIIGGGMYVECLGGPSDCRFLVNGVECGSISTSTIRGFLEFPQLCLDTMTEGANDITISVPSGQTGKINTVYLEMEVLPANC